MPFWEGLQGLRVGRGGGDWAFRRGERGGLGCPGFLEGSRVPGRRTGSPVGPLWFQEAPRQLVFRTGGVPHSSPSSPCPPCPPHVKVRGQ